MVFSLQYQVFKYQLLNKAVNQYWYCMYQYWHCMYQYYCSSLSPTW